MTRLIQVIWRMIPIILVSTSGESTASLQSSLTLKADASLLDIVDEDCYGAYYNKQHMYKDTRVLLRRYRIPMY